jgi:hypothetical protein
MPLPRFVPTVAKPLFPPLSLAGLHLAGLAVLAVLVEKNEEGEAQTPRAPPRITQRSIAS